MDLIEKSRFPRHKVCGEFFSPEATVVLERLGALPDFLAARPATISRFSLHFAHREKHAKLPRPGYGLSRYRFDQLLLQNALNLGATLQRPPNAESYSESQSSPLVIATGRQSQSPDGSRGARTFGFKAHFKGPVTDAVELYFFNGCYVGLNAVEDGITNVCGLGPESLLAAVNFDIERLILRSGALTARLRPLHRIMEWLTVGPLLFKNDFDAIPQPAIYPAGDRLSFVDPFTGSGLLSALVTGSPRRKCGSPSNRFNRLPR